MKNADRICDEQEQVKNLRVYLPAWDMPSEGPKIVVWKNDKLQVWIKNNNVLLTMHDKTVGLEMLKLVKQCDPRFVVGAPAAPTGWEKETNILRYRETGICQGGVRSVGEQTSD